jgi:hypothetical protein
VGDALVAAVARRVARSPASSRPARAAGDPEAMLAHATDYLDLFATVAVAWQWLELAAATRDRAARGADDAAHRAVTDACAGYWFATELPRHHHLATLCRGDDRSYRDLDPAWL